MEKDIWALIPAYCPAPSIVNIAKEVLAAGIPVLVVDDGSGEEYQSIFASLEKDGCTVLHQTPNQGKGAALKAGFAYLAGQGASSAVTADADGQHLCKDIVRVANALHEAPTHLIMGVREVSQMPSRSRIGNGMTRTLFAWMYGVHVSDTQTGLRGIPLQNIQALLALSGERYEYEMAMLVNANRIFDGIDEVPIETVYEEGNPTSHFRPVRDGLRVYGILFHQMPRYILTSLSSSCIDYTLFSLFYYFLFAGNTTFSTVLARVFSATGNYLMNKHFVFKTSAKSYNLARYAALALVSLALNCAAMYLLTTVIHIPALVAKLLVEAVLYLFNFVVQSNFASGK